MRIEQHPKLNIWVREDGCVYVPQSGVHPAHWTFGGDNGRGYLRVMVNGKRYVVHRLVAEAFLGEIPSGCETDHIDRDRSNNAVTNIRIVSRKENQRNTSKNDRVDARGGTHLYVDKKQYWKEREARRRKTHKYILFSDGKQRHIPNSEAQELLKLPVKERTWPI